MGYLYSFNGSFGRRNWFTALSRSSGWVPAADGFRAYASFGGSGLEVMDRNGVLRRIGSTGGTGITPVVGGFGQVFTRIGHSVNLFDPIDGSLSWNYLHESPEFVRTTSEVALRGETVYVNFGDSLTAIARDTGEFLWEWEPPVTLEGNIVVTDSHLFVGSSTDSRTFAIDLSSKTLDWSTPNHGALAVSDQFLFISGSDSLQAFRMTASVPEPSTVPLFLAAVLCMIFRRRI